MLHPVTILDHVAVTVSDLERSLVFYRDRLGLREVERHLLEGETISTMAGKPGVVLQVVRLALPGMPGLLVDLQQYLAPPGRIADARLGDANHSHLCFGVADLAAAYRELSSAGVEFVSAPVSFALDWGSVEVVFLKDPDGFIIELMQMPAESPATGH